MKKQLSITALKRFIRQNGDFIASGVLAISGYLAGCMLYYKYGKYEGKRSVVNTWVWLEDRRILRYFDPETGREINFSDAVEIAERIAKQK